MRVSVIQGFFVLLIACCCGHTSTGSNESTISVKDGIFIHISRGPEDPHRVLMALQMTAIMSEDRDVLVYFDAKGIEVVLKDAEDFSFSHFPSSKTQIQNLLSKQVPIMACPGRLKAV